MSKLKIILDARRQLVDGTYPLKLSVFINNKGRFMINTGISVNADQWKNNEVVSHSRKKIFNDVLRFRFAKADDLLLKMELSGEIATLSLGDIKDAVTSAVSSSVPKDDDTASMLLKDAFTQFANSANKEGTKSVYLQTLAKLGLYYDMDALSYQDVTLQWLREFEAKMKTDNLSTNAVSVHLRNLRAVFNRALDDEIITIYPFRKFKIKTEKTVKRSLTVEQLRTLRDYECQEHQTKYRDMFMLIFYLMGINMVDLANLKTIADGRIEFRRAKTGRLYSMKVEPEAMEIIEKYRGQEYLLNICDNYANYKDFLHRLNNNLKQIGPFERVGRGGKKVHDPLFPSLTTYWARHTWATIAASLDIPKETIAEALGHGGNSVTDIYINFDQRKVDQANRKVIDYING